MDPKIGDLLATIRSARDASLNAEELRLLEIFGKLPLAHFLGTVAAEAKKGSVVLGQGKALPKDVTDRAIDLMWDAAERINIKLAERRAMRAVGGKRRERQ